MADADLLIDTSLLIQHLRWRGGESPLERSLAEYGTGAVSIVSDIEYQVGELHAGRRPDFAHDFPDLIILSLSAPVLTRAPYIQAARLARNKPMDFADLLIAATAVYHRLPLLTLNVQDFRGIQGLRLLKVQ